MTKDAFTAAVVSAAPKGGFVNIQLKADLDSSLTAAARKAGVVLFRESRLQAQATIPYKNVKEVREAIERGDREAPRLPAAAIGVDSVIDGVIFYTPKVAEKGLLTGFRPIRTLESRFVDQNGAEVSLEKAKGLLVPSYFKARPTKAEHAAKGTGEWRTTYLTTITEAGAGA